jgi:hypothetical protein
VSEEPPKKRDWEHVEWPGQKPPEKEPSTLSNAMALIILIVLSALLMGGVFVFGPYFMEGNSRHYSRSLMETDTMWGIKVRFWTGVAVGGVGAVVLWIRAVRDKD